jgi:hypothetical protein
MALGSTHLLTEISTRNLAGDKGSLCIRFRNTMLLWAFCLGRTSHNPMGLQASYKDSFSFFALSVFTNTQFLHVIKCIMRFDVLTVKSIKFIVFWNVRLCSLIIGVPIIGEIICLSTYGLEGLSYPVETALYQRLQASLKCCCLYQTT